MGRIPRPRVPVLIFVTGIAAAFTFGASSVVAAPKAKMGEPFFCGYHMSEGDCQRCCGGFAATWGYGGECYCGPDGST